MQFYSSYFTRRRFYIKIHAPYTNGIDRVNGQMHLQIFVVNFKSTSYAYFQTDIDHEKRDTQNKCIDAKLTREH